MRSVLLVLNASLQRDLKTYLTYKFNIFGEIFYNFIMVFILFYISYIFQDSENAYLSNFNNNYFLFLISGVMILLFLTRAFSSMIYFTSSAQTLGYFESLLNTKADLKIILLGSILFPFMQALFRVLMIFIFAFFFDPESIVLTDIFLIWTVLLISSAPFIGIAYAIAGAVVMYKRATFLNSFFILGCTLFSGIFYPITVMPQILQYFSIIFPSTFAVNLLRGTILDNTSSYSPVEDLVMIVVLGILYIILGTKILDHSVFRAKRDGTTSHY